MVIRRSEKVVGLDVISEEFDSTMDSELADLLYAARKRLAPAQYSE